MNTRLSKRAGALVLLLALLSLTVLNPARAQSPNVSPNIFDPTLAPYNADKTGATDAAAAINQAISDAVTWGNANSAAVVVSLPAGKYLLQSNEVNIYYARNNVTFTGHSSGDTFLLYTKAQSMVTNPYVDTNATHTVTVTLQNFTEDASDPSQLGYTQGTITAIDPATNSATLQVESGYPLLNRPDFVSDATQGFNDTFSSALYTFSDPKRPIWDHPQGLMQSLAPSADGTTAVVTMMPYYRLPSFVHVGSRFAILDTPSHVANSVIVADNVTYQNINYYGGLDSEADGASEYVNGNLTVTNYYQGPPPTPAEATATRPATFLPDRLVTAEEGFQTEAYGTTSFIDCDMSGGWDDVLDLGGGFATVLDVPSGTSSTQLHVGNLRFFQPGDIIELNHNPSGAVYVASDQITAAQTQSDGSYILTLATAIPSASVQVGDYCTDRSCAGPIVLQNSSFSSMNGHVFLKCGGLTNPGISVTGCTLHDMSDNGLEVVGAPSYGQGPLEARNVLLQNNLFENCQNAGIVIQEGTAVTGSNVQILNNTFLDTGDESFETGYGVGIILDNVDQGTISGNWFDRTWSANVCGEYDTNLKITNNTFSHPNFIRPSNATAYPYTGQPVGGGNQFINPDPSSVVYLANDAGVTLSGNIVYGAGAYTQQLTEINTNVTGITGQADGVTQIDNPLAFDLSYDGLVMDQPSTGSILDQAAWTGGQNQTWLAAPTEAAPGYATLADSANGKYAGNGGSTTPGTNIDLENQAETGSNPASEQLWDFAAVDNVNSNLVNGASAFAIGVPNNATTPGALLAQAASGNAPGEEFEIVTPPAPQAITGLGFVTLDWAPVPGATSYSLGRATTSGGPYSAIASNLTTTTYTDSTLTDTTLTPGTTYYYVVTAAGVPLAFGQSAQVFATPGQSTLTAPALVRVSLAQAFDTAGIEPDGWVYQGGGIDGSGNAYSGNLLGSTLAWNGSLFALGTPSRLDSVSDSGQRITLPPGNFSSVLLLGGSTGSSPTSVATFAPTITYVDQTSAVLSQGMTSIYGTASQPGESNAATLSYINTATGAKAATANYVHGYQIALDPTKTTQWLDLPDTGDIRILAMDLVPQVATLGQGQYLATGQYLTSPSGKYYLTQQSDGNLVLYKGSGPSNNQGYVWASGYYTSPAANYYSIMQSDGNVITHTGTGPGNGGGGVWASGTYGYPGARVQVTDAGQVQILSGNTVLFAEPTVIGITSLSPSSVAAGAAQFTLTINGTGFTPQSTVSIDGTTVATQYVSATTLTATVPSSVIPRPGSLPVAVTNPTTGESPPAYLTVLVPAALSVANTSGAAGGTATLTATVINTGSGQPLSGLTVSFTVNGVSAGTAQTGGTGAATLSYPIPSGTATGSEPITATFAGDANNASASGSGTLTIVTAPTAIGVASVSGNDGQSVTLTATLTRSDTGQVIGGEPLAFTVNGASAGAATTNSSGTATLSYTIPAGATPGYETISVAFAGDATHMASTGSGTLSVYAPGGVNLSSFYNVLGIEPNGATYPAPGVDGYGYTYSFNLTGSNITWNGVGFTLGPPSVLDCLSDAGQVIPLPQGTYSSLLYLGEYMGNGSGTFSPTVTYTGGTTTTFAQGMTNWCGNGGQTGEATAATYSYRNYDNGTSQTYTNHIYGYSLALNPGKILQSITLPSTGYFRIMAISLTAANATPPSTTDALAGTQGTNGWYKSAVTVTLTATAGTLPIAHTYYTIDGGTQQTYSAPFTVSGDNSGHTITFWSVDTAGNAEATHTQTIKIDATAPTLTFGAATPAANANGWNNSTVSIPYTDADATSGVATATPGSPLTFAIEGASQTQTVTVTDNAGNTITHASPAVNIDLTAPVTTGAVSGTTVTLSATDNLSGVAATYYTIDGGAQQTYTAPFSVTGTGSHTISYQSIDKAGNSESTHTLTFTVSPVPTASKLTPSSATAGNPGFTLTVTGTNFTAASAVQWQGNPLATTFVSSTKVTAAVPAADIATAASVSVTVANPAPGGGASKALTFSVVPPVLQKVTLSPATLKGGTASTGTVTLTGPAPSGGIVVSLSSSVSAATVPASVTVAAGSTTATFPVMTVLVPSNVTAQILASCGSANASASLLVQSTKVVNVKATAGTKQVTLTWTSLAGASSYTLYRSTTSGGEGSAAYKSGLTGVSYVDTGLTTGTTYYYELVGVGGGGMSARSSEVSAKAK